MEDMEWDDARIFLTLAREGTLTGAAMRLGLGVATVSRRIDRLETALAVPLFVRHQTGYRLTDQGKALLPRAEEAETAMIGLTRSAEAQTEIAGHVRLATAETLVAPLIAPALAPLLARHPRLSVEILTHVNALNLHRREADMALRTLRPERGYLVGRRLGWLAFGLYAAPGYLARRAPGQLRSDDTLIGWPEDIAIPPAKWLRKLAPELRPRCQLNTLSGQLSAASSGIGLAILPDFLAVPAGLQPVLRELPDGSEMVQPLWLVIHADLSASRRVRAVAEALAAAVTSWLPGPDAGGASPSGPPGPETAQVHAAQNQAKKASAHPNSAVDKPGR